MAQRIYSGIGSVGFRSRSWALLTSTTSSVRRVSLRRLSSSPPSSPQGIEASHPGVGTFVKRSEYLKKIGKKDDPTGNQLFLRAGLPFLLFSLGAWWVVASAIDGKLKERAASRREVSLSERQVLMEDEHTDMMTRLNKAAKTDFDNTKRIERPEDILRRRKADRDKRNVWYRRTWRWVKGEA